MRTPTGYLASRSVVGDGEAGDGAAGGGGGGGGAATGPVHAPSVSARASATARRVPMIRKYGATLPLRGEIVGPGAFVLVGDAAVRGAVVGGRASFRYGRAHV
ncbi:hypothetical protein Ari01nite_14640 [Paractinoplanes rishiriensis]|uniref:Uncharacterized protein n=1 Tax=Paractinoplanes rishiriensis TaxID=1050105 RepID=A0A919MT87_9ACTN|nr:hypothetical protein Ari01nite_14640 [Actinoplanes rishiriensis]